MKTNKFIDSTNPEVKAIMTRFFDEVKKLYDDMDNLTIEEFTVREKAMWAIRSEATELGEIYLVSLWSFEDKVRRIYGDDYYINKNFLRMSQ